MVQYLTAGGTILAYGMALSETFPEWGPGASGQEKLHGKPFSALCALLGAVIGGRRLGRRAQVAAASSSQVLLLWYEGKPG